jgi:hypothetical protein
MQTEHSKLMSADGASPQTPATEACIGDLFDRKRAVYMDECTKSLHVKNNRPLTGC